MNRSSKTDSARLFLAAVAVFVVIAVQGCGSEPLPPGAGTASAQASLSSGQGTCITLERGAQGQVADAKISSRQPGRNFGDEPVAAVSHVGGHREYLLLRFDLSAVPQQATVTSATLALSQINSGRPVSSRAHAITQPWSEASVTWDSFGSAFEPNAAATLEASGASGHATRSFDVSGLVTTWLKQPSLNHGLLLAQPEDKTLFDTSEAPAAGRRPRLEICYTEEPAGTPPAGTSLLLQVTDSAGAPIAGAAISSQDAIFPADSSGHFLFENLHPGAFLARVDAHGFASATVSLSLEQDAHVGYQVRLLPLGTPQAFQAEEGGVILTDSVRVTLPPGAIVDALGRPVSGTVQVTVVPLDPTAQLALAPGPLAGTRSASGERVQLESLFMAEVSLWSNGAPVQLAPGAAATLEFALPDSVASRFAQGDTLPAWWFDLDAGLWREEGVGTIQPSQAWPGKLAWVATVHHFTWWNADMPWTAKSCVRVRVVNGIGLPVPFVQVNALGESYNGTSEPVFTGLLGYACIEIMRGGTAMIFTGTEEEPTSSTAFVTGSEEAAVCGTGPCIPLTLVLQGPGAVICEPGTYRECGYTGPPGTLGQGWCKAGRRQCNVTGTQWSACVGEVRPSVVEDCFSPFDEDCDGSVNENCTCSELEGEPCYTGSASTKGVGACRAGSVGCDAFGLVECSGQQLPTPERCSTLADDDCDGSNECTPVTQWHRLLGGSEDERVGDIAIDGTGHALITGGFEGTMDLGGGPLTSDSSDFFVARFDAAGGHVWSQVITRDFTERWNRGETEEFVAVDGAGNVLLAGHFRGGLQVGGLTLSSISPDATSLFVVKLSPTGALLWARAFGGTAPARAGVASIATDALGNVLVTGKFERSLQVGGTTLSVGGSALYVLKLDGGSGAPVWSTAFDGAWGEDAGDVAADAAGDVLVTGSFTGALTLGAAEFTNWSGMSDAFLAKLQGGTGTTLWGKQMAHTVPGMDFHEQGMRVVADGASNALLLTWSNVGRAWLTKFAPGGEELWSQSLVSQSPYLLQDMSLSIDAAGNTLFAGTFLQQADLGSGVRGNSQGLPNAFLIWRDANGQYLEDIVFASKVDATGPTITLGRAAAISPTGDVMFLGNGVGKLDFGAGEVTTPGAIFLVKIDPTP